MHQSRWDADRINLSQQVNTLSMLGQAVSTERPTDSPEFTTDILFLDDLAALLRTSRSTIERRRRNGCLPFPELASIDKRPRWSRSAVQERLLTDSEPTRRAGRRAR
jgi:hypothetical protein